MEGMFAFVNNCPICLPPAGAAPAFLLPRGQGTLPGASNSDFNDLGK